MLEFLVLVASFFISYELVFFIHVHVSKQAEADAGSKDKELNEALERMRQYESVSLLFRMTGIGLGGRE